MRGVVHVPRRVHDTRSRAVEQGYRPLMGVRSFGMRAPWRARARAAGKAFRLRVRCVPGDAYFTARSRVQGGRRAAGEIFGYYLCDGPPPDEGRRAVER